MDHSKIMIAFNKFAGKEVIVHEQSEPHPGAQPQTQIAPHNPVLDDLRQTADDMGIEVRILLPGMMTTMDYRDDRLNIYVDKDAKGKWRIQNHMRIG